LKIPPAEIKVLAQGALLHDVGKIAIPDAILRKPGKLSMEEQEIMRTHCARGYEMLCRIPFLADASEIVLTHHERFDGDGYPRGLRGTDIPLGARVFAVADALDAITSDRPYRKADTFAAACESIHSCSGAQFDPSVVAAFSKITYDVWLKLRAETVGDDKGHVVLREVFLNLPDFSNLQNLIAMSFSDAYAPDVH
jgi:HD-GYP domain-containing protein (c-di-GMP phosphodiesterase class II)